MAKKEAFWLKRIKTGLKGLNRIKIGWRFAEGAAKFGQELKCK